MCLEKKLFLVDIEKAAHRYIDENTTDIKIFCSGSSNVRVWFERIAKSKIFSTNVSIQLLTRNDRTAERAKTLEENARRWVEKIDGVNSNVSTEIKSHDFRFMYRGVIINDSVALIGLYYKTKDRNLGYDTPVMIIHKKKHTDIFNMILNVFNDEYLDASRV